MKKRKKSISLVSSEFTVSFRSSRLAVYLLSIASSLIKLRDSREGGKDKNEETEKEHFISII